MNRGSQGEIAGGYIINDGCRKEIGGRDRKNSGVLGEGWEGRGTGIEQEEMEKGLYEGAPWLRATVGIRMASWWWLLLKRKGENLQKQVKQRGYVRKMTTISLALDGWNILYYLSSCNTSLLKWAGDSMTTV